MQVKQNGTKFEFFLEGPISEKCPLFDYSIGGATEIIIDMTKVTFINSIGVKNWIVWTLKVPKSCQLLLQNCPFVIINQINMVNGFLPPHARVQSFFAPYISDTGKEVNFHCLKGQHYDYAAAGGSPKIAFPEKLTNDKGENFEPDFVVIKITKFLSTT